MQIFTIRDSKAEAYLQPFYAMNVGLAVRMITESAQDQGTMLYKYPSDFELFSIGSFDEHTGIITGSPHVSIGKIVDFLQIKLVAEERS